MGGAITLEGGELTFDGQRIEIMGNEFNLDGVQFDFKSTLNGDKSNSKSNYKSNCFGMEENLSLDGGQNDIGRKANWLWFGGELILDGGGSKNDFE